MKPPILIQRVKFRVTYYSRRLCKVNPSGELSYLCPDKADFLIHADEVRRDMDGLLLPAKAAHMEAQTCHGWVTAVRAAWCAAMRGLLKSGEPVLDSGPVLGCASRAAPSAAAEAPAAWTLSCIAGH